MPTIQQQLNQFAKQPNCDRFRSDSERISLLLEYLWLRQLSSTLTFEVFLEQYAVVADYSEENLKHPADALKRWCPRTAKAATAAGLVQWTAAECVKAMAFYVDIIREAEASQSNVPLSFAVCLEKMGPEIKAGAFDVAEEPAPKRRSTKDKSDETATQIVPTEKGLPPQRPSAVGQPIAYRPRVEGARSVWGRVVSLTTEGDRQYVTFQTPEGQAYTNVSILDCEVLPEAPPELAAVVGTATHWVPAADVARAAQTLQLAVPMGNVKLGDLILGFSQDMTPDKVLAIDILVRNAAQGPMVEAELIDTTPPGTVIGECPPRKELLGEYRLELKSQDAARLNKPAGVYAVTLKVRGQGNEPA